MSTRLLITSLVLGLSAAVADAAPRSLTVQCYGNTPNQFRSNMMHCNNPANFYVNSRGPDLRYAITLRAPATHCSDIRYTVTNRDGLVFGRTDWLSANRSSHVIVSRLPVGANTLKIKAEGRVGGCNSGYLHSWGVIAELVGYR